ncbi:MAG TPA: PDZ domain-containing protein [Candidatus Ruania gallistercoris]|uniref:Tricorn protease homolog n=1 Tax=Candidatus Ruania gallistercoris TaxID=2838746 RepID=A0A9D2EDK2_9MICO|nr:PDZ domain-containing protein [Candidatus Ruania gallistercoris]
MTSAYLRDPDVHADLVTFVAADDVWLAPVSGGRAWRLTHDSAPARSPRFSPDGRALAYVSYADGHPELMLTDIESGRSQRLTWWGSSVLIVLGWADQQTVLVASNAGEASIRHTVVKAVRTDGTWQRLQIGAAGGLARHPDGALALSTFNARGPAIWKRYRGGTASRLWLDRTGAGDWQRLLPGEPAALVSPLWVGDALVFVSDRAARFPDRADEQANLWLWETPGVGEPRQLTHQGPEQGYVRDASTDGTRITWHSRGRIWLLEDLSAHPRTLELSLPGTTPAPVALDPNERLETLAPDHTGAASVVGWRGKTFWLTHRDGPARALAAESGVRVREPVLLGRTSRVALVTDAEGADALEIHTIDGSAPPQRILSGQLGRVLHLAADPAGNRLAAVSHDGWVRLIDVSDDGAASSVRDVTRSGRGEPLGPTFSPDGRYLLWSEPTEAEGTQHRVMILDTQADEAPVALTSGQFHDRCPAVTDDGKFVVFLSDRTLDPEYDTQAFDLSFTGATRPWLIPIAADEPAPFGPSVAGRSPAAASPDHGDDAPTTPDSAVASPDLDARDAEQRIMPFPVPSANYRDLRVAAGGVLWIKAADEVGTLGSRRAGVGGDPAPDVVQRWSFADRDVTTIVDKAEAYAVSGDGQQLVVRHEKTVTLRPATRKPTNGEDPTVVTVDTGRLRFDLDPMAEWQQMFAETTRLMAEHFWRADMDGVDFTAVIERWRPVVAQVRSHDDLVDLLWETVGELNTSHAYVMPADPLGDASRRLGLLGADLTPADGGWRIERILPGESSDPGARSPLLAAGVGARPGDLIVAVDGVGVDPVAGPARHLVGAADTPVELTLRRGGTDRRVVVLPLADEEALRYQDWVRSRREYVRERSDGRLGYLHVPDMMSAGWAQLHRDLHSASLAEGVIADVRYNRGGHTSQLVVAKLAARVISWSLTRYEDRPAPYPDSAPRGPVVLVANEYSGSDGDIVNAAAQALGVGPVVGVRTWGGVIGIDGRYDLVDGTAVTQPRYATWMQGKGWGVENHGVDPDIEVVHTPADLFSAADPQLDRAIAEALARLEETPAAQPPPLPAPKVR